MGHDALCPNAVEYVMPLDGDDDRDHYYWCDLVAKVRADERERMAHLARVVQGGGIPDVFAEFKADLREQVQALREAFAQAGWTEAVEALDQVLALLGP